MRNNGNLCQFDRFIDRPRYEELSVSGDFAPDQAVCS